MVEDISPSSLDLFTLSSIEMMSRFCTNERKVGYFSWSEELHQIRASQLTGAEQFPDSPLLSPLPRAGYITVYSHHSMRQNKYRLGSVQPQPLRLPLLEHELTIIIHSNDTAN